MRRPVLCCERACGCRVDRLKAIVAHLRAQLPGASLLLAGLLPRGFVGDRTGQWQTRRADVDGRDWPNPFSQVRGVGCQHMSWLAESWPKSYQGAARLMRWLSAA